MHESQDDANQTSCSQTTSWATALVFDRQSESICHLRFELFVGHRLIATCRVSFMQNGVVAKLEHIQLLVLERVDPARNMARYYVLSVEPTLFGDTALVREWGRIGRPGRRRLDLHAREGEARVSLGDWFARKLKRGYCLSRDAEQPARRMRGADNYRRPTSKDTLPSSTSSASPI
jgi:predicted DNA-binding WGR domain protein